MFVTFDPTSIYFFSVSNLMSLTHIRVRHPYDIVVNTLAGIEFKRSCIINKYDLLFRKYMLHYNNKHLTCHLTGNNDQTRSSVLVVIFYFLQLFDTKSRISDYVLPYSLPHGTSSWTLCENNAAHLAVGC